MTSLLVINEFCFFEFSHVCEGGQDEEWRGARREWNKPWRASNEKNLVRSLDHQALTCKVPLLDHLCRVIYTLRIVGSIHKSLNSLQQNDRKMTVPKALTSEIEMKAEMDGEEDGQPHYQFMYSDPGVFRDVTALVLLCLDRVYCFGV